MDFKHYDKALDRVNELLELDLELEIPQSDELEILVLLIEKYEDSYDLNSNSGNYVGN